MWNMWTFKKKETFWEERFNQLAVYNSEIFRGIVHTDRYDDAMKKLQEDYDKKMKEWTDRKNI